MEVGGRVGLSDESLGLEKMLGHFEDGGEGGRDVNENWEDGDLMKEIRWTKENLEQTMQLLKDCVNDNQTQKSRTLDERKVEEEVGTKKDFTKMELGRLLDNMDGYVAPRDEITCNKSLSSISSPPLFSCEEDSDQEELFEDSTEEMAVSPDTQHVDVQVVSRSAFQDGDLYDSSPEISPHPPSAPLKQCVKPLEEQELVEEDEILIVSTSSHHQLSQSTTNPIQVAVERLGQDMEHLRARVSSLETILSLRSRLDGEQSLPPWWPLPGLSPRYISSFTLAVPLILFPQDVALCRHVASLGARPLPPGERRHGPRQEMKPTKEAFCQNLSVLVVI